jgi:hypothetical protein
VSGGKIKDSGRSSGGSSFGSKVKQSLGFGKSSSSSGTPIRDEDAHRGESRVHSFGRYRGESWVHPSAIAAAPQVLHPSEKGCI